MKLSLKDKHKYKRNKKHKHSQKTELSVKLAKHQASLSSAMVLAQE